MLRDGKFIILVFAAVVANILGGCAVYVPVTAPVQPLEETTVSGEGKDKVLVMDITGLISDRKKKGPLRLSSRPSMVARIKEEFKKAKEDDDVKALILRINSPGGTVTASDIIYHEVKEFRKEKGVKVVACLMGLGTSGGYYVATAADKIVAHPTCVTGSIGVMLLKVNMKGLMEKIGIQDEIVKSGEKKDSALPFRSLSPEERELLQGIIDSLQRRFIEVVEEARPGVDLRNRKELADGRVFTAQQALELGFIDKLGYLDDAIELAKQEAGIEEAKVVMYKRPAAYKNNIYSLGEDVPQATGFISAELVGLGRALNPDFMYLWMP
ncbi:MAG: signal peptide peptidase SppA [Candidatus Brocadiales bacterium]